MGAHPLNNRAEKNILQITLMMKSLQKEKGRNNYNIHFSVCVAQGGLYSGLLQRLFCRLRRRREEEKVGTIREIATYPTPRKEAAAPLTPAWQTVCPTLQQPWGFTQGFANVVFSS